MIIVSDNSAAKMLVKKFTPQKINEYLAGLGFKTTRLKIDQDKFGYGLTTPKEITEILEGIYKNTYFNEEVSEIYLNILKKTQSLTRIVRYLPKKIDKDTRLKVAHKSGSITGVRSDVGIVFTNKPYVISVLSKDISDNSFNPDNEGALTIAKISKVFFDFLS